jgi:hypothetical protein
MSNAQFLAIVIVLAFVPPVLVFFPPVVAIVVPNEFTFAAAAAAAWFVMALLYYFRVGKKKALWIFALLPVALAPFIYGLLIIVGGLLAHGNF